MSKLERGQGSIEYALILVLVAVVAIVVFAVVFGVSGDSQDVYEQAYNNCVARETISSERCHDIALMEAYPSRTTTIRPAINP